MKFYKSKFFIISLAVAVLLVLIPSALSVFGHGDIVRSALKTVAKPFEWCGTKIADGFSGFVEVFKDYDKLKEENEKLKDELASKEEDEYEKEVLKEENQWLKTYLKIKSEHPELTMTDATVVSRQSGNFSTVLTLNRGSVHGIKKKMPIITSDGLFGHVSEVGLDWCKVVSLVETASSVSAYTERGKVVGVVEGDSMLRDNGICKMTYIDASADIKVGDKVFTGGSGSIYPEGLLIGSVTSIEADEFSRTLIAYIEPAVNFVNISSTNRVMIITGYDNGGKKE